MKRHTPDDRESDDGSGNAERDDESKSEDAADDPERREVGDDDVEDEKEGIRDGENGAPVVGEKAGDEEDAAEEDSEV